MQFACLKLFVFWIITCQKVECLPKAVTAACQPSKGVMKPVPEYLECWDTQVEYFNNTFNNSNRNDGRILCESRGFEGLARFRGVLNAQNAEVILLDAINKKGKLIQKVYKSKNNQKNISKSSFKLAKIAIWISGTCSKEITAIESQRTSKF